MTAKLMVASMLLQASLALLPRAAAQAQGSGSATMDTIRSRGQLAYGVSTGVAGFSLVDSRGTMQGIDADTCQVVAAAVLGDATKVRFVPTTTTNRFTALQSGEIDLLNRSATWTLRREGNLRLLFATTTIYDGTGFLAKAASGARSAKNLDGATICVQPGTGTELAGVLEHAGLATASPHAGQHGPVVTSVAAWVKVAAMTIV